MKEEELINKLKSAELPSIEMPSHRRRLKMALLTAGCPQRRKGFTLSDLVKSIIKGGIDFIMKGLLSRQPVWKTASISLVGLALVITLCFTVPSLFTDSAYAKAVDIVKNSPEIRAALGNSELEGVEVAKISVDNKLITVIAEGNTSSGFVTVTADVDLANKQVAEFIIKPKFTEAEIQKAIAIAEADPEVRKLLDKGAVIVTVAPLYSLVGETGEINELPRAIIQLGEERWFADIDLDKGQVIRLDQDIQTKGGVIYYFSNTANSGVPGTPTPVKPTQVPPETHNTQK